MMLSDFVFVYYENFRSRAYAQALRSAGIIPEKAFFFGSELKEKTFTNKNFVSVEFSDFDFHFNLSVKETLGDKVKHVDMSHLSGVNSSKFIEDNPSLKSKFIIYSGAAGVFVSKELIGSCRGVIHVHGGYLPDYRGSTCFYYSILDDFTIGASAIILNDVIDGGKIIVRKKVTPIKGINVDYVLDPILRSSVLVESVNALTSEKGLNVGMHQETEAGCTYQVIHPVLKHIALKKLDLTV